MGGVETALQYSEAATTEYNVSSESVVSYGVDTLNIGYFVDFWSAWDDLKGVLRTAREKAREIRENVIIAGVPGLDGLVVYSAGQRRYLHHVGLPSGDVFIMDQSTYDQATPNVIYKPHAQWLWLKGIRACLEDFTGFIRACSGVIHRHHINLLALAVDVVLDEPLTMRDFGDYAQWQIPRLPGFKPFADTSGRLETLYIGDYKKGQEWCKIYDKLNEMKVHDLWYMLDLWGREVLKRNVYRFEWSYKRDPLKKYGVITVDDVIRAECTGNDWLAARTQGLWCDSCLKHARYTVGHNKQKERRLTHPLWEQIMLTLCDAPADRPVSDKKMYKPRASDYYLEGILKALAAFAGKYAEEEGLDPATMSYDDAMTFAYRRFRDGDIADSNHFTCMVKESHRKYRVARVEWEDFQQHRVTDEFGTLQKLLAEDEEVLPQMEQDEIPF